MRERNQKNRPFKICETCNRAFSWRKKWENNWEHVRFCSRRCRSQRKQTA